MIWQEIKITFVSECLDDLGSMIKDYGINVLQPSPANSMKLMAKQIADRDKKVRDAALNAITEAYFQVKIMVNWLD